MRVNQGEVRRRFTEFAELSPGLPEIKKLWSVKPCARLRTREMHRRTGDGGEQASQKLIL